MATNLIPDGFRHVITRMARETLESELAWVFGPSSLTIQPGEMEEAQAKAKERVAAMTDEQVFKVLEATAPKPCPECGR